MDFLSLRRLLPQRRAGGSRRQRPRPSRGLRFEPLEARRLLASDWQNPVDRFDVNSDGSASASDALNIINYLNANKPPSLSAERQAGDFYLDVDGDRFASAIDVLQVINELARREQPLPQRLVSIPAVGDDGPCGTQRAATELATCLNEHIEAKSPDVELKFDIAAGEYLLTESVFLFERSDVSFVGAGAGETVLRMDQALENSRSGKIDLAFTFNVINSSRVSLRDLSLEGANLSGQRAVGVCPTAGRHVSKVEMANVSVSEFPAYVLISGRSIPDQSIADRNFSTRPGPARFMAFADASDSPTVCGATVSDIALRDSEVSFQDVVFYVVPYSGWNATQATTIADWPSQADQARTGNTRFAVTGNHLRAAINDAVVDSAIKAQGAGNMRIEGNTIDANGFNQVFGGGAAINIAANMRNVLVRDNTIVFPENHDSPERGLAIHSGFGRHAQFGVGTNQVTVPAQHVEVVGNTFVNAHIVAIDSCRKGSGQEDLSEFCSDVDAAQETVRDKVDDILISDNIHNGRAGEDAALVSTLCGLGAVSRSTVTCRENVSIRYTSATDSAKLPFAGHALQASPSGEGPSVKVDSKPPSGDRAVHSDEVWEQTDQLIPHPVDAVLSDPDSQALLSALDEAFASPLL